MVASAHPLLARAEFRLLTIWSDIRAAGTLLQAFPVDDGHYPPPVRDPASPLEFLHGDRHAGPRSAEHNSDEFMGKRNLMSINAIISHEKPASQALLDFVAPVRERSLRALRQERVRVMQEKLVECRTRLQGFE